MEVQEPMLQSHAKSLIPGNKVLMTLLLRLRLRPTMSSQIPKIELRQRLTVLNLCWKPKFPRLLATGSECPNESTRRTRRNNTSLLLDAFSSASLLYMLFTLQFPLSYGLIIIFLIALLS